jgi:uncharacterized protein (TIGR00369 family)
VKALQPADGAYAERVAASFARQPAMAALGSSLGDVLPGRVEILQQHRAELTQQHGYLHAGIVATVLDSACGYAAFSLMPETAGVLTTEFKVNLLAPAAGERLIAIGRVIKPGRTLTVTQGEVHAESGGKRKLVAIMTATLMTVEGRENVRD